jgi:hypothetical protein
MKKFLFSTLLLASLSSFVFSQNDSLETAILQYDNKQLVLIQNGRSMLLEHVMAGEVEKATALQHYLETKVENDDYLALYEYEKWLLDIWAGRYYKILTEFRNLSDSTLAFESSRGIPPPNDLLAEKLVQKLASEKTAIFQQLDKSGLESADREFLKLFAEWLMYIGESPAVSVAQINEQSSKYIDAHPNSDFRYFVGNAINQEVVASKGGLDVEFFSGYGGYTGRLRSQFGHHVPFGVAFNGYYKKWVFGIRDHISLGKLDQPIDFQASTWEKGSNFNHIIFELSTGYMLVENHRLAFFPFGGIGFHDISPQENQVKNNPDLEDVHIGFIASPVIGANLDFKLKGNPRSKVILGGYGIFRIRAGYCPTKFTKKEAGVSGSSYYLTIGFGVVAKKTGKKYKFK